MSNLSIVTRIGAGVRMTESATTAIVAGLPDGFDASVRGAVTDAVHSWACGDAVRPAVKIGAKGNQKSTDYGRGVDALVKSVKSALSADKPKPVRLAVTLSGDGAPATGSVIVAPDHALYAALVALIAESTVADVAA